MIRDDNWVLSVGTFLPMVGVLILFVTPKANEAVIKMVALLTSIATVLIGAFTLVSFNFDKAGSMQFVAETSWIPVIKSTYFIGVDGISLPLYLLSMVITLLVVIYSLDHIPSPGNPKAFFVLMLILQTGMAGTFIAQDLILFFVFFELVLLPMYFMIGVWGGEQRQYASIKFFLYTMFGSALMLVAFLAMFFKTGAESFAIPYLVENGAGIAKNVQVWIFAGMFVGFAVKVPMFPFHTWLPDAHVQAPTAGSVILAGILLKLGTYGLIRFNLDLFPEASRFFAPYLCTLAVIGIIYGALVAMVQTDVKKLVAYSSVSHLGFVVLGIFSMTEEGVQGA
ncbi:MAG: NuoM family protein, partial [Actinomycetota bacterium]